MLELVGVEVSSEGELLANGEESMRSLAGTGFGSAASLISGILLDVSYRRCKIICKMEERDTYKNLIKSVMMANAKSK